MGLKTCPVSAGFDLRVPFPLTFVRAANDKAECYCHETSARNCPVHQNYGEGHPGYMALLDELRELHIAKSSGYGTTADPLSNFSAVNAEKPWRYAMDRMAEKLHRAVNLSEQDRDVEIGEELIDVASLGLCAEALRREAK